MCGDGCKVWGGHDRGCVGREGKRRKVCGEGQRVCGERRMVCGEDRGCVGRDRGCVGRDRGCVGRDRGCVGREGEKHKAGREGVNSRCFTVLCAISNMDTISKSYNNHVVVSFFRPSKSLPSMMSPRLKEESPRLKLLQQPMEMLGPRRSLKPRERGRSQRPRQLLTARQGQKKNLRLKVQCYVLYVCILKLPPLGMVEKCLVLLY